jgi:MFS family permease
LNARAFRFGPFAVVTATLTLFLFGASAPTPLYVVYQQRFGFSATTLTAVFAVYALALLVTLIPAGTLSDQVGRRPVVLAALGLQAAAMAIFLTADSTAALFAARIVQGIATGAATGALSAELIDLQPSNTFLGALTASVAPPVGLALGALCSGALLEIGTAPLRLVYWVQLGGLALAAILMRAAVPETVARVNRRIRIGVRIQIPSAARSTFTALAPGVIATWGLAGLYLSLGPSLAAVILHTTSHITGGLVPATLCATTAAASVATRSWDGRRAVLAGTLLLAGGVLVTLGGIRASSGLLLFLGSAIAGFGFGPAFAGTFRTLAPLAAPDARAGLLAAVYVLSYLAFSVPAVIAGLAAAQWGLRDSASGYALAVVLLAAAAATLTARRGSGAVTPARSTTEAAFVGEDG